MTVVEFTKALAFGFAQLLGDADIGLTWSETADYSDDDTGIWIGSAPLEVGRCVSLMPLPLSHDPTLNQSTTNVQFIARSPGASLFDAWLISDAIDQYLLGLFPVNLPTDIRISALTFGYGGSMGQDDQNRWSWSANYTARHFRPSSHRH